MNNNNIEEDIKICKTFKTRQKTINYNKITLEDVQSIESILADRERLEKENTKMHVEIAEQVYFGSMPIEETKQLQAKANKYDSLVEKIKENIKFHTDCFFNQATTSNPTLDAHSREKERYIITVLQELLKGE